MVLSTKELPVDHTAENLSDALREVMINIYYLMGEKAIDMAGYCTSVQPYFHEPQASENTAQRKSFFLSVEVQNLYALLLWWMLVHFEVLVVWHESQVWPVFHSSVLN